MYRFHIPNMKCNGCLGAVTRAIQALDPQAQVKGDLGPREVEVTSDRPKAALVTALRDAGYPAQSSPQPVE